MPKFKILLKSCNVWHLFFVYIDSGEYKLGDININHLKRNVPNYKFYYSINMSVNKLADKNSSIYEYFCKILGVDKMIITNKTDKVITLYNSEFSIDIASNQNADVSNDLLENTEVFIKYCFAKDVQNEIDAGWSSSTFRKRLFYYINFTLNVSTVYSIKLPIMESVSIVEADQNVMSLLFPSINLKLFRCVAEDGTEVFGKSLFTSVKGKRSLLILQFMKILILSCLFPLMLLYSIISSYSFINKVSNSMSGIEHMLGGWIIFLLLLVFYVPNLKLLICALKFKCYDK